MGAEMRLHESPERWMVKPQHLWGFVVHSTNHFTCPSHHHWILHSKVSTS